MKAKILIVEDETILREAYAIVLREHDYQVSTAANGQLALAELTAGLPDLILLDMLMPVMNGKQFLEASEVLQKHKSVRVIVYSNLGDHEAIEEMRHMGIHGYMLKSSMAPNELADYVQSILTT